MNGRHRKTAKRAGIASGALLILAGLGITTDVTLAGGPAGATTLPSSCPQTASGAMASAAATRVRNASVATAVSGTVTPLPGAAQGIDVSSHNAEPTWATVKSAGVSFVGIKATEGDYYVNTASTGPTQPGYAAEVTDATTAGLYVMPYAFANPYPGNGSATCQADYAWQEINSVSSPAYATSGLMLPVALDIEQDPYVSSETNSNSCYGLSTLAMVTFIQQFLTELQKDSGKTPIVYTNPSFWSTCTGNSTAFTAYPLWLADYGIASPPAVANWGSPAIWQYTSSGTVTGVTGAVDENYLAPLKQGAMVGQAVTPVQVRTLGTLASPTQSVTWSASGLPAGLQIDAATGVISGTPTSVGSFQVTATSTPATGTSSTVSFQWVVTPLSAAPAAAVGVEGSGGALMVQAPQLGSGWHSLGGDIVAPPAVASVPNPYGATPSQPLFIGTGSNGQLYMRSLTVGWQSVGPAKKVSCIGGPAAAVAGTTLTLACRGTNNALWVDTATVPSSGLPQFTNGWTSLGGVLTTAPAVAPVGGAMTFFVRGSTGGIYTRTLAAGFSHQPWTCIGAPAAAVEEASSDTIFACQGTDHAMWVAVNGGLGWSGASSFGGGLVGGPAIAATSRVPEFFIEGGNHAVWKRTATSGWGSLGSSANGGVGADALN